MDGRHQQCPNDPTVVQRRRRSALSPHRLENEPFGFFEFVPEERLDLDLVDRVLLAAIDETGGIDVVVLPESAVDESDIVPLESLLAHPAVIYLHAGVRERTT